MKTHKDFKRLRDYKNENGYFNLINNKVIRIAHGVDVLVVLYPYFVNEWMFCIRYQVKMVPGRTEPLHDIFQGNGL